MGISAGRRLLILICIIVYAAGNTGSPADALVWAPTAANLAIKIKKDHFSLRLSPNQQNFISVNITNIGSASWQTDEFYLQTVLPGITTNYPLSPVNHQRLWSDNNKTLSYRTLAREIGFGRNFNFYLPITAPSQSDWYRFYLQPIIQEYPIGNLITVDLKVGKRLSAIPVLPAKRIEINLNNQTASIYEGQFKLAEFTTSTGRKGMETPPGQYIINKKLVDVASGQSSNMRLPYWMELRDLNYVYEGYGIHGVPYYLINIASYKEGKTYNGDQFYSSGKLYEGYFALGKPVSQGCVILSLTNAEMVFNWTEPDKTLVNIQ